MFPWQDWLYWVALAVTWVAIVLNWYLMWRQRRAMKDRDALVLANFDLHIVIVRLRMELASYRFPPNG